MTKEEYLRNLIIEKFGAIKPFARAIDMPPSTLYSILKNVDGASISHIFKICKPLEITADDLAEFNGDENKKPSLSEYEIKSILSSVSNYDYVPHNVTMGKAITLSSLNEFEKIAVPDTALGRYAGDPDLLFVHVNGDSMDKVIEDGALIAIKRGVTTSSLRDKDIVVLDTKEGYTVKVFYSDIKNNRLLFKPLSTNPTHISMVKPLGEDIHIVGRVVAFIVTF